MRTEIDVWLTFVAIVAAVMTAAVVWWAVADLVHTTLELPFAERLAGWRRRLVRDAA